MTSTRPIAVKICGITSIEAVEAAVAAGAQYGGLVFHPASPRNIEIVRAAQLAERMRGRLKVVALVADATDMDLTVIASQVKPDFFQLHGGETPARVAEIRGKFGVAVIKALPIAQASDFDGVADYEDAADMLLFDARPPTGANRAGGHGAAFDWSLLKDRTFARPWFLAGGLTPDNVGRAAVLAEARMVDVSSGVESAPGVKDAGRIAAFLNATKIS
ncbi:MAG TPA: phosphoribosylanthranilate isomerase [Rhizomicrobium sp.]|nr:phosphoribosylanthranilate isomerase [Rhizomicrobium sp.]